VQKIRVFFEPRPKNFTNSYVELKGYVGGKVPYETHRMDLRTKLLKLLSTQRHGKKVRQFSSLGVACKINWQEIGSNYKNCANTHARRQPHTSTLK
jgi:hypothetical protein